MSGDDTNRENDTSEPAADIPEIEAEIVDEAQADSAAPFDDPAPDASDAPTRRSFISPGVLFFAGLVAVALAAGLYWYFLVDKSPAMTTSEPTATPVVVSTPADVAAEIEATEKFANADLTDLKSSPSSSPQDETAFADITTELTTPEIVIENAALAADAKGVGVDPEGAPDDETDDAPSIAFELTDDSSESANAALDDVSLGEALADPIPQADDLIVDDALDAIDAPIISDTPETPADLAMDQPAPDNAAIASLEAALAEERNETAALRAAIENAQFDLAATHDALAAARTALTEAQGEVRVLRAENDALKAARREAPLADAAIALNAIEKAADAGAPFKAELATLSETRPDADAVAVLNGYVLGGAPTLDAIRAEFDEAARAGLAVATRENADGVVERYSARIGALFNIRPATPQPGDAPAAVISRAEHAVEKGDLTTALTELDALPPAARDAMRDWTGRARARADIDAALQLLNAELAEKAAQPGSL